MQNNSRDLGNSSSGESIKVFVRVRPPDCGIDHGDANTGNLCLEVSSPSTLTMQSQPEPRVFTFDHVAGPETTQVDVFSAVGRPIIDSCMAGYNGTIFAYGQTGSGKTFTMIGPADEAETFTHELRGVIPRSFEYLFSLINREKMKLGELVEYLCKCSFLEIYNEQVYDLLDSASAGLHLRESIKRGVYVDGLIEEVIMSAAEAYQVLSRGWINRRVASTSMNRESSRSHAVFTLAVESKKKDSSNSVSKIRTSLLNLVDLAGSERQRDTQSVGMRLKEAGSINRSLSALGNVIMALVDIAHGKSRHVHYRDSKLTFLLRDSLGGNAKTNLIANVHPTGRCFGETLSTLSFARRAKMIKNKAVVNEDTTGNVLQLQLEIRRLREIINKFKSRAPQESVTPVQPSSTSPLLDKVGPQFTGVDESVAMSELREMLAMSMRVREKSEADKMLLLEKIEKLENLCKRKDRSIQSSKMILKLRDSHVASLEKKREDIRELNRDELVKLLRSEIEQLNLKIDHHPEVTKFAKENLDLRADKKRLEEMIPGAGLEQRREISRLRQYTLQLERQLRPHLQSTNRLSVAESSSTSGQLARLTEEVESLRAKAKLLQQELDESRESRRQDVDKYQQAVSTLEASLGVAKRTQQELEKTIESLHMKHTLERTSMNTSHLRMIKALVTPRSACRTKSTTSTPAQGQKAKEGDQLCQKLFFAPLSEIQPQQAPPDDLESPLLASPLQLYGDGDHEGEGNINDALGEELSDLQEANCGLHKQLESKESQLLQMSSRQTELESRVLEVTRLCENERESARNQEQSLRDEVSQLSSENNQLNGDKTVLVDEIQDLRLCLQSADRELVEVKADLRQEREQAESKSAELYLRIGELEQHMSARTSEWERALEGLQNLQDEVDTLREEVVFKEHCLQEREDSLREEKKVAEQLEQQLQALEEQIEMEKEKTALMTSQLEEGSKRELAAALDENGHLMTELNKLRNDLQQQLTMKQTELDSAQASILALTKRTVEDKEAIADFMASVQAMRAREMEQESREAALRREGEEKGAQLAEETAKNEELGSQLEEVCRKLEKAAATHKNEIKMKDMQYELLADEMTEKLHELSHICNMQKRELTSAQDKYEYLQKEVDEKQLEVQRLQQLMEEKASTLALSPPAASSAQFFSPGNQFDCILHLETELANRNDLICELQERKDAQLQQLQAELDSYVQLKREFELLQTKQLTQQYKLEADSEEFKNKEAMLKEELNRQERSLESARTSLSSLLLENEKLQLETQELRKSYDTMAERVHCMEQQMERVRAQEEDMFREKENLHSQLETVKEEKAKLAKENKELVKENAQLSGHRNLQQRIQYHAKLKLDYHKLIEEHQHLKEQLQSREEYIHSLLEELAKSDDSDSTHFEKFRSGIRMLSKENIQPS